VRDRSAVESRWGNAVIEAAACDRPSRGALRQEEALVDGETGILVDGRNVAQVVTRSRHVATPRLPGVGVGWQRVEQRHVASPFGLTDGSGRPRRRLLGSGGVALYAHTL
jgi:antitoxin (DNA-binding transcriptional repressor) of toxin-antitoxin stability system